MIACFVFRINEEDSYITLNVWTGYVSVSVEEVYYFILVCNEKKTIKR